MHRRTRTSLPFRSTALGDRRLEICVFAYGPTGGQYAKCGWNRGAIWVRRAGALRACHTPRNALGRKARGAQFDERRCRELARVCRSLLQIPRRPLHGMPTRCSPILRDGWHPIHGVRGGRWRRWSAICGGAAKRYSPAPPIATLNMAAVFGAPTAEIANDGVRRCWHKPNRPRAGASPVDRGRRIDLRSDLREVP